MKKLKLLLAGIFILLYGATKAQVVVNVDVGSPPQWGPVGYSEARYYYLPGVETYYDVHSSMFIYYYGNTWVQRTSLPKRYRNYDLYRGYKVVLVDYHGDRPYREFSEHKRMYSKSYHEEQRTIGERPEKEDSKQKGKSEK